MPQPAEDAASFPGLLRRTVRRMPQPAGSVSAGVDSAQEPWNALSGVSVDPADSWWMKSRSWTTKMKTGSNWRKELTPGTDASH
jgi:hypothetical protein